MLYTVIGLEESNLFGLVVPARLKSKAFGGILNFGLAGLGTWPLTADVPTTPILKIIGKLQKNSRF